MPLDPTEAKKIQALGAVGELYVIGLSQDSRPRRFTQGAEFFLLPALRAHVLRLLMLLLVAPLVVLWVAARHRVDVIAAQSPYEGAVAVFVGRLLWLFGRRIAIVVEDHGNFEEILFLVRRVWLPRLYRAVLQHTAGFALRHCDVIRTVSRYCSTHVRRFAPDKPILEFPAWTDVDVFVDAAVRRDSKSLQHDVLYAGVLTPLKGIHHLVRAFGRIAEKWPDARLLVVGGEENPGYARCLRTEVKNLDLGGRVVFTGRVPQRELAEHLRTARVLVLPSYTEGLPRVVMEALIVGTPVIATSVGGVPELIEDGMVGFLVQPGDEAGLAERLARLLEDDEMAREMGRRAREVGRHLLSTEGYVNGYRRLCAEALRQVVKRRP
jgi:glycosyltransferase involved in cell wall biosynthesis